MSIHAAPPGPGAVPDPGQPGWVWSEDDLAALSAATARLVTQLLVDGRTGPVTQRPSRALIEAWTTAPWLEGGVGAGEVLAEFAATSGRHPFGNAHPRYAAWVNSPPHPLGVAASALAAAMNPSVAGGNHAAVHLEHQVVRWFADLLGWPEGYAGQLVSGGSAATLTSLQAARHQALRRVGIDERRDGITAIGRELRVYASSEAHGCVTKAVEALGIGSAHITRIGTDAHWRLDPADLDTVLTRDRAAGMVPVAVVASVGTVNTGAIDPILAIADVCTRHGVWLHVDGAYGAPAVLLLDEWPEARAGLARANSVALDPHKWLYTPVDAGLVLFRDETVVRDTFSLVPPYLRTSGDADEPVWYSEYGLEQTRPFRALKVWMQLTHLGRSGYRNLIARDIAVAEMLREELERADDFEVLAHGLSVVCFRHLPRHSDPARPDTDIDPAIDVHAHNEALLRELQAAGHAFLAGTRVGGRFALRACIVNPLTTSADVIAILDEVRRCAELTSGPTRTTGDGGSDA